MNSEQTRRSFFATMALGVSASAFSMMLKEFDQNQSLSEFNTVDPRMQKHSLQKSREHIALFMMVVTLIMDYQ